jgi:hypothetical protein
MLTIPLQLPVKRMAMYGSTAMLVGFTGTLAMLRQFAPKSDTSSGVSVVETINRKPSQDNKTRLDVKQSEGQSTASVTPLPEQESLTVRGGSLPTQQYPRIFAATPTYNTPASGAAVANPTASSPAGVVTDGVSPHPAITPSPQPASESPVVTMPPAPHDAIPNIDLNNVVDNSLTP